MKAFLNQQAFAQTTFNSGRLSVMGVIAHPLPQEGHYVGRVFLQGKEIATFRLDVQKEHENRQVDIDLARLTARKKPDDDCMKAPDFGVGPEGYLVLYVSGGPGGYHVTLDRLERDRPRQVLDTQALRQGDLFVLTLLRPGLYEMVAKGVKGKGLIRVAYPKPSKKPFEPPAPERITVNKTGFSPNEVKLSAAQGVIFAIEEASKVSVAVQLVEPDDGPDKKGGKRGSMRWRNPSMKKTIG